MQTIMFVFSWLKARIADSSGQDLIEYAMLGGLIAAAMLAVGVLVFSILLALWFTSAFWLFRTFGVSL